MSKNVIEAIHFNTNGNRHNGGQPYPDAVIFFRKDGYVNYKTGERNDFAHGCRSYNIRPNRDSFWRALRAMRRLAMRKYESEFDKVQL